MSHKKMMVAERRFGISISAGDSEVDAAFQAPKLFQILKASPEKWADKVSDADMMVLERLVAQWSQETLRNQNPSDPVEKSHDALNDQG